MKDINRCGLVLLLALTPLHVLGLAHPCGLSSTPCQAGCWNPSTRVQADGLQYCEIVSPGYYSPDNDDAQYACPLENCVAELKNSLGQGVSDCSPFATQIDDQENTANYTAVETTQEAKHGDDIQGNLKYITIFVTLALCFIYIKARIQDCGIRQKNRIVFD